MRLFYLMTVNAVITAGQETKATVAMPDSRVKLKANLRAWCILHTSSRESSQSYTEHHQPCEITQCYLPPDTGEYCRQAGRYSIYLSLRDRRLSWRGPCTQVVQVVTIFTVSFNAFRMVACRDARVASGTDTPPVDADSPALAVIELCTTTLVQLPCTSATQTPRQALAHVQQDKIKQLKQRSVKTT